MAELVKIAQARGENRANAIFFHGLGGDARTTWQPTYIKKGEASLWLEWLAQDIEGVSVYSVSYEAALTDWQGSVMELSDRATNVLNLLLLKTELWAGELILAGHSLGGLVIKQLLRKAADEATDRVEAWHFIKRIRKVAFFATPHVWADLASWSDWLHNLTQPSPATRLLLNNDSHLRDLNLWYRTWAKKRGIDHLILTETQATSIFGGIIRPDNSNPGLATDPIPIDSDHIGIVKPINRESETYQLVRNFIMGRTEQPVLHKEEKIYAVKNDAQAIREYVDRRKVKLCMNNAQREALDRRQSSGNQTNDDPLAELAHLTSGQQDSFKRVAKPKGQSSTEARQVAAAASEAQETEPLQSLDDDNVACQDPGTVNEEIAYIMIMAAIIIVGMVCIGASVGYRSGASPPPEIATISENGPAKPQREKTNRSDVPPPDASILGAAPQPSPGTVVTNIENPLQPRETMPAAGIAASPEQIETQVELSSQTAPIEPEKMNSASVERHDALLSSDMPPRATATIVPLPVPRPAAVVKASTPKPAARANAAKHKRPASTGTAQPMQATDSQGGGREPDALGDLLRGLFGQR